VDIPEKNQDDFKMDWLGMHKEVGFHVVWMAASNPRGKLPQERAGKQIANEYKHLLQGRAGWWGLGLFYNRVYRCLQRGPNDGTGVGNPATVEQTVRNYLETIAPGWEFRKKPGVRFYKEGDVCPHCKIGTLALIPKAPQGEGLASFGNHPHLACDNCDSSYLLEREE